MRTRTVKASDVVPNLFFKLAVLGSGANGISRCLHYYTLHSARSVVHRHLYIQLESNTDQPTLLSLSAISKQARVGRCDNISAQRGTEFRGRFFLEDKMTRLATVSHRASFLLRTYQPKI